MKDKSLESRVKSQMPMAALRSCSGSRLLTLGSRLSRGMTLIELLVVIVILTTIVGAAIPLMSPSNDDRRLREAARGLNTYITGAQTRAIGSKRPYGIALKRLSHDTKRAEDNGACLEVFYVEQPQAYAGFDANSRACVSIHPTRTGLALVRFVTRGVAAPRSADGLPDGWDIDLFPNGMIRPGDVIQINGTRFELLDDASDANTNIKVIDIDTPPNKLTYFAVNRPNQPAQILARPVNDSGQQINPQYDNDGYDIGSPKSLPVPPPFWALPSPYKILRQPTPASDEPYQLPEGTAIDLRASGVGTGEYFYVPGVRDNDQDVVIMFAPEGRVSRVSFSTLPTDTKEGNVEVFDQAVVDNLYLLVGRRENIEPPDVKTDDPSLQSGISGVTVEEDRAKLRAKLNWLVGGSRWIVIGSQSGRIATVENASVDMAGLYTQYTRSPYNLSPGSDELRNQQILAAREFTREMAQLSGR